MATPKEIAQERYDAARLRRDAAMCDLATRRAKALSGSFTNAKRTRLRPGARPQGGSGQAHRDRWSREVLRRECQAVSRNNPIAQALIDCVCELLVGDGPQLAVLTADEGWNRAAQEMFSGWSEACDVTGRYGLADLLEHGVSAWHTDGRSLLLKAKTDRGGMLQEIEDERIGNPTGSADTEIFKAGVEIAADGRPIRYHIAEWRRDESSTATSYLPVDARFVIELASPRVKAARVYAPEPVLASVLTELELVDDSVESTAIAYRIATLFGIVTATDDPAGLQAGLSDGLEPDGSYTTTGATGDPSGYELQPGMGLHMGPNTRAYQVQPQHPTTGIDKYAWMMVQLVAARLGVAIDLSHFVMDGNYSASRSRLALAWRRQSASRRSLRRVLGQVSRWKIAEWIGSGKLPEVDGWDRHEWKLAPMPMLDPKAEIETRLTAIDGLLMDYQVASDELGLGDWAATVKSRQSQREAIEAAGLEVVRPGNPKGAGDVGGDNQPLNR